MPAFFASPYRERASDCPRVKKIDFSQVWFAPGGFRKIGLVLGKRMGIDMKKVVLLATALAMISGSALAADLPVKANAPAPAPFDPWDVAFGGALMSDYIFRGITQ